MVGLKDLAIVEDLHWYSEAALMRNLGYVLMCQIHEQTYTVDEIRHAHIEPNLEVHTLQGWVTPDRCWAVLRDPEVVQPFIEQPTLF